MQSKHGRARKIILSSSDDDDDSVKVEGRSQGSTTRSSLTSGPRTFPGNSTTSNHGSIPTRSLTKARQQAPSSQTSTTSLTPTPTGSPERVKSKAAKNLKKPGSKSSNAKTIYSFFNAATQVMQKSSQSPEKRHGEPEQEEELDTIEDDFIDGKAIRTLCSTQTRGVPSQSNKRPFNASIFQTSTNPGSTGPAPSLKYRKALNGGRLTPEISDSPIVVDEDTRPWAEKYAPIAVEELVVHKKKVSDVQQWLKAALAGQPYRTLLILKGAAGSGKTVTLSTLSKSLDFEIVEWRNPAASDFLAEDYISMSAQFEDFITRGRTFNSLDMVGPDGDDESAAAQQIPVVDSASQTQQVLLVEDLPYAVFRAGQALQSFRSSLLQCLAERPNHGQRSTPVVLIITESVLSNNMNSADNLTAHRLLGPDVLYHPGTTTIEFNPVAPTFITKALNSVLQKHRRSTGAVLIPDAEVIQRISHIGDVRNAVATLEFLSTRERLDLSNSLSVPVRSKSRAPKSKSKAQATVEITSTSSNLALVSLRESSIGLFHAVGKIVYNKRSATATGQVDKRSDEHLRVNDHLPTHLSHHDRLLVSEVSVSTLIDETGTDSSTFLSALFENYILSCASASGSSEATLDTINACLDVLSDSDMLLGPRYSSVARGGASEGVRQDELAFETSVRGILHALPHPVKRQTHPGRSGSRSIGTADAHRMFYPTDLKIWRKREEITGLVDLFVGKAMDGTLLAGMQSQHQKCINDTSQSVSQPGRMPPHSGAEKLRGGVGSWKPNGGFRATETKTTSDDSPGVYLALGSGHSARQEMLLERLPYLARILPEGTSTQANYFSGLSLTKQIAEITCFKGIGNVQDDEDCNDLSPAETTTAALHRQNNSTMVPWVHRTGPGTHDDVDVRGLVLSDDDIEDD